MFRSNSNPDNALKRKYHALSIKSKNEKKALILINANHDEVVQVTLPDHEHDSIHVIILIEHQKRLTKENICFNQMLTK